MSTCYTESDHAYGLNAQDITSLKRSCFLQRLDISHLCGAFYEKKKKQITGEKTSELHIFRIVHEIRIPSIPFQLAPSSRSHNFLRLPQTTSQKSML